MVLHLLRAVAALYGSRSKMTNDICSCGVDTRLIRACILTTWTTTWRRIGKTTSPRIQIQNQIQVWFVKARAHVPTPVSSKACPVADDCCLRLKYVQAQNSVRVHEDADVAGSEEDQEKPGNELLSRVASHVSKLVARISSDPQPDRPALSCKMQACVRLCHHDARGMK